MDMRKEYRLKNVIPAFLGGADQSAQWRTPPFKALLRQWWRVAWWNSQQQPQVQAMREAEGDLFGRAADKQTSASRVRIRLSKWGGGEMNKEQFNGVKFGDVPHPEVKKPVGTALYLAYGAVGDGNKLVRERALAPNEERLLRIGYPREEEGRMAGALRLVALFGTVGGRARNGWGSFQLQPVGEENQTGFDFHPVLDPGNSGGRNWLRDNYSASIAAALDLDWCHAIGRDDNGLLLWRTGLEKKWEAVLKTFAEVKIAFRTQFQFGGGGPHHNLCDRQLLAYPVTRHELAAWKANKIERSANQIFFKVMPVGTDYAGLVVHLPHGLPKPMREASSMSCRALRTRELDVWKKVHRKLDEKLQRLA